MNLDSTRTPWFKDIGFKPKQEHECEGTTRHIEPTCRNTQLETTLVYATAKHVTQNFDNSQTITLQRLSLRRSTRHEPKITTPIQQGEIEKNLVVHNPYTYQSWTKTLVYKRTKT